MKCRFCGAELPKEGKFCVQCGKAVDNIPNINRIVMKCNQCGGVTEADSEKRVLFCPYCGSKELIIESDAVKIEKIRNQTYKELELEKLKTKKEERIKNEERSEIEKYRKRFLSKITFFMIVVCFFSCINDFSNRSFLGMGVAIIQVAMFMGSWMIGMGIINVKKHGIYVIFVLMGFLLISPYNIIHESKTSRRNAVLSSEDKKKLNWPISEVTKLIPKPISEYGEINSSTNDGIMARVYQVSEDDYADYVRQCKEKGFVYDVTEMDGLYYAKTVEWYDLNLFYDGDDLELSIFFNIREAFKTIQWPTSDTASMIPLPESNYGSISYEHADSFLLYVANTSKEEFDKYVESCSEKGFIVDYSKGEGYYYADHQKGYHLSLEYHDNNVMSVELTKKK